jgi:hypothetical protein
MHGMKSRAAITVLGLTVCLQLVIIVRLAMGRAGPPPGQPVDAPNPSAAVPQNSAEINPNPGVEPFQWAQLESMDYVTYVRNLRLIHCPEQTLRDIISADVDYNLYAAKREKLQSQEQQIAAQPLERGALQHAEQELWNEESSLINRLLGQNGPQQKEAASGVAASPADSAPAVLPLAFWGSAGDAAGLNDYQKAAVERSQQTFLMSLDGLDSKSPEYARAWRKAQPNVDAVLEASLGDDAYQKLQLEAWRQKLAHAQPQQ